jgi:phospholipase/carboxylesterase
MLESIEIETAGNPDAAIIWLHGLGADGHDFESIVPAIVPAGERAWRFVFPHAPVRPVTLNGGLRMRAWYDIKGVDRHAAQDEAGFIDSSALVGELIQRQAQRGIAPERVVLGGFSQGGALSLYMLSRYPQRLAAVVALSCYLPLAGSLLRERNNANDGTPVFMAHGREDPMIGVALGAHSRDFLRQHGYDLSWHEYSMGHSVCAEEIAALKTFLFQALES